MRREGFLYLTLMVVMWGISFVATKVMVMHMPPITSGFLRFVITGVILPIAVRGRANYNRKKRLFVMLGNLFGITLYFVFENIGLHINPIGDMLVLNATLA